MYNVYCRMKSSGYNIQYTAYSIHEKNGRQNQNIKR